MSTRRKNNGDFMPTDWKTFTIDPSTGEFTTSSSSLTASDDSSGDVDGSSGKGWLASLWNKLTGAGTTKQQDDLNAYAASEAQKQRDWSSSEAAANRRFQAQQAQLDYDRQVEFYEHYQSIGAQIRQYKENGLNPALLAGGVTPSSSAPSASSPAGSMPSGVAGSATSPISSPVGLAAFLGQVLNLVKLRSDIDLTKSKTRKNLSESAQTDKVTSWYDVFTGTSIQEAQQRMRESAQRIDESLQNMRESVSRIDVNNSRIRIGEAEITLMGSEKELNETKSALHRLDAEKTAKLMPYVQKLAQAELNLKSSQGEDHLAEAEESRQNAAMSLLKQAVEQGLIDKGYYDSIVGEQQWDEKGAKRDFNWGPVNDICSNLSKICVGVGSVVGAVKGTSAMPFIAL